MFLKCFRVVKNNFYYSGKTIIFSGVNETLYDL